MPVTRRKAFWLIAVALGIAAFAAGALEYLSIREAP
jgi:hypothetical protein